MQTSPNRIGRRRGKCRLRSFERSSSRIRIHAQGKISSPTVPNLQATQIATLRQIPWSLNPHQNESIPKINSPQFEFGPVLGPKQKRQVCSGRGITMTRIKLTALGLAAQQRKATATRSHLGTSEKPQDSLSPCSNYFGQSTCGTIRQDCTRKPQADNDRFLRCIRSSLTYRQQLSTPQGRHRLTHRPKKGLSQHRQPSSRHCLALIRRSSFLDRKVPV